MQQYVYGLLEKVRKEKPIVHFLTNWVTIYDCANIVKVFGASPVMAHEIREVDEMAQIASALVLNIGTLTVDLVEAMKTAARSANRKGIPVVLDVCGAGATKLRDAACLELLSEARIDVIKGNASEIARIAGRSVRTNGVDSADVAEDLRDIARSLAQEQKATVVITGKDDIVSDGTNGYVISNGDPMMASVVGTGCMAAAVIGTFAAVEKDLVRAATAGLCCYEIAAEDAVRRSGGPGTFKEQLFDAIYGMGRKMIEGRVKVESFALSPR